MTEHSITKDGDGYIIQVQSRDWLTVVWTLTVGPFDLAVKCHTVTHGLPNEDGLAVLFEDAQAVRLEAL